MSGTKLDDLFDHAEANLDSLFDQAEADDAANTPDFLKPNPEGLSRALDQARRGVYPQPARPADIPAPPPPENPTLGQMILPNTMNPKAQKATPVYSPDSSGRIDRYIMTEGHSGFDPLADLAGLPTRALGSGADDILPGNSRGNNADGSRKSFGQGLANPDAGLMRPARDYLGEVIAKRTELATDADRAYAKRVGDVLLAELAAGGYIAAAAVEDPTILIPGAATPKALAMAERLAPKVKAAGNAVAEAPNRLAGRVAEEFSGVSEEALRMATTKEGRAALQDAAGRQSEIGDELLRRIQEADEAIPERQKVEQALAQMGDMDLGSAIKALEDAKVKPVQGRLLDNERAANAKIDTYINALRGGPEPANLPAAARESFGDLNRARTDAANSDIISKSAGREVAAAAKEEKAARSDLGKVANRIKTQKQHGTDFGWWHEEALQEAKAAAEAARKAAQEVQAGAAAAGVRSADAEAAAARVVSAERAYAVADAAAQLAGGASLKDAGRRLITEHGLRGDDLRGALNAAKKRVEAQPPMPDLNVSAPEYRELRKRLDVNIDFDTEEGALVNAALKKGRGEMKDALIRKARESGNPEYETWMKSWATKIDKLEELKAMLGGNARTRSQRVERFIGTLFGKNTEHKRQLMKDLGDILGGDILGQAKTAALAGELGKGGKAAILPRQFTGRSVLGFAVAPTVAPFFASPALASRFTLPFTQGLETVLKRTGGQLSKRSMQALEAASKARSAALQMRLLKVIEEDAKTLAPMRQVAQSDQTRTEDRRYATR